MEPYLIRRAIWICEYAGPMLYVSDRIMAEGRRMGPRSKGLISNDKTSGGCTVNDKHSKWKWKRYGVCVEGWGMNLRGGVGVRPLPDLCYFRSTVDSLSKLVQTRTLYRDVLSTWALYGVVWWFVGLFVCEIRFTGKIFLSVTALYTVQWCSTTSINLNPPNLFQAHNCCQQDICSRSRGDHIPETQSKLCSSRVLIHCRCERPSVENTPKPFPLQHVVRLIVRCANEGFGRTCSVTTLMQLVLCSDPEKVRSVMFVQVDMMRLSSTFQTKIFDISRLIVPQASKPVMNAQVKLAEK